MNELYTVKTTKRKRKPTKRAERQKLNAEEVALIRREIGVKTAARIEKVAPAESFAAARGFRIAQCAERNNIFVADNLQNKDGELFKGTGRLAPCNDRFCPNCSVKLARDSRRKGRGAVNKLNTIFNQYAKKRLGLRWRSVLLTMPLMKGSDPVAATERIQRAFGLLIERSFWKTRVKGGIKGVEFTVRTTGDVLNGFHVHIHLLVLSKFIAVDADKAKQFERHLKKFNLSSQSLVGEWRYCLNKAGANTDSKLSYKRLVVSVMDTKNHSEQIRGDKTNESAIMETAAYMCKFESWKDISDKDLVSLLSIERWGRMFETLGAGRPSYDASKHAHGEINDAGNENGSLVPNMELKSGNNESANNSLGKVEKMNWRTRLKILGFAAWKEWQTKHDEKMRAFRRRQVALMHPLATFYNLAGDCWDYETIDNEIQVEESRKYHLPHVPANHYANTYDVAPV
jgi:hypothetical protein